MASTRKKRSAPPTARRLKPAERERLILIEAKKYFSERGLNGGTEELAKRLGVTQPLLFRYFPTKIAMIDRIFHEIEESAFDPDWVRQLLDDSIPLEDRLTGFYTSYFNRVMTKENFRLFLYGGLAWSGQPTPRYYGQMRRTIYPTIARAIRPSLPASLRGKSKVTDTELEIVLTLHAIIYHLGVRRWVFSIPLKGKIADLIRLKVKVFLGGIGTAANGK
ncbi:MAG: TetR/AcrR family transcriptional regulator [Alphaproteobacteria bacterium]|nr:TetR/AcrR family transcriptional regulator [Alphaproteobacteria bacterium]